MASIIQERSRGRALALSVLLGSFGGAAVWAQETSPPDALEAVVVSGTRIRQTTDTATTAPVAIINPDILDQQGFSQIGDALNQMTSNTPNVGPLQSLSNGQAMVGQDFPNLFNLGAGRTLSLVNGRRVVSSSSGLGDEAVDTNIIPVGLLDRVDVVQGGGAAVYGSGAIAGVVNYVLKDHFQGAQVDAQVSRDSRGDYPVGTLRATLGTNFSDGRGNVAFEFDYSGSGQITSADRYYAPDVAPNLVPGAGTNKIPTTTYVNGWNILSSANGLVVTSPYNPLQSGALQINGQGIDINSSGSIVPKNLGTPIPGQPYLVTGDSLDGNINDSIAIVPKVTRVIGNLISHYELTDNIKVSADFLFGRTDGVGEHAQYTYDEFTPLTAFAYPTNAPLPFTKTNPYLSPATIAALSAANPGFAAGQPLYLSKDFQNLDNINGNIIDTTKTFNGVIGLDGDFNAINRHFYWSTSYAYGDTSSANVGYEAIFPNFRYAANAVRNSAGQIVCAANVPVVTAPNCVPINIFGTAPLSGAAQQYIEAPSGAGLGVDVAPVENKQSDILATIGGELVELPGGKSQFSLSYEHRTESSVFSPLEGDLLGIFYDQTPAVPGQGSFHTNEAAAELDVPVFGKDFSLPLVKALDLNGSFRFVENSIAASGTVWGTGMRWTTVPGMTFRASYSRNFRAPDIAQVLAPPSITIGGATNPCSNTNTTSGPAPTTRFANCLALFTANPSFGLASLPAGVANTPANRLAHYTQSQIEQTTTTTAGNPDLNNEISTTTSYGFVLQPAGAPGLTASADRIVLNLKNALTLYGVSNFASTCFDSVSRPAAYCGTLSYTSEGDIAAGTQTTVNAGSEGYRGETYNIDYRFPLNSILSALSGTLDVNAQATHSTYQSTTVAGSTTRTDNTPVLPNWVARLDVHYSNGPLRVNYTLFDMSSVLLTATSNVYNSPDGVTHLAANIQHNVSVQYDFGDHVTVRAGVNDIFDRLTSYPSLTYGSIIGRQFFVGVRAKI